MTEEAKFLGGGAALGALAGAAGLKGLTEGSRWAVLKKLDSDPAFAKSLSEKMFRRNPDKYGVDDIINKPKTMFGKYGPSEKRLIQRPLTSGEFTTLLRNKKIKGKAFALAGLLGAGGGAYLGYKKLMNKQAGINPNILKYMQTELLELTKLANEMTSDNVEALQSGAPMPHTSETSASTDPDAKGPVALPSDPIKKERPFSLHKSNPKGRVAAFRGMFGRKARKPALQKTAAPPMSGRKPFAAKGYGGREGLSYGADERAQLTALTEKFPNKDTDPAQAAAFAKAHQAIVPTQQDAPAPTSMRAIGGAQTIPLDKTQSALDKLREASESRKRPRSEKPRASIPVKQTPPTPAEVNWAEDRAEAAGKRMILKDMSRRAFKHREQTHASSRGLTEMPGSDVRDLRRPQAALFPKFPSPRSPLKGAVGNLTANLASAGSAVLKSPEIQKKIQEMGGENKTAPVTSGIMANMKRTATKTAPVKQTPPAPPPAADAAKPVAKPAAGPLPAAQPATGIAKPVPGMEAHPADPASEALGLDKPSQVLKKEKTFMDEPAPEAKSTTTMATKTPPIKPAKTPALANPRAAKPVVGGMVGAAKTKVLKPLAPPLGT